MVFIMIMTITIIINIIIIIDIIINIIIGIIITITIIICTTISIILMTSSRRGSGEGPIDRNRIKTGVGGQDREENSRRI